MPTTGVLNERSHFSQQTIVSGAPSQEILAMTPRTIQTADVVALKKRLETLQRNYDLYDSCKWHDAEKRDEYVRLAKLIAEAEMEATVTET